jgi:hypothetical protein
MKTKLMFISTIALTLLGSAIFINPKPARAEYTTCASSDRLCLRKGDSGAIIQSLVSDLRKAGYYNGKSTNRFNSEVESAVKAFQTDYQHIKNDTSGRHPDLDIDGIVGQETVMRLCQKVYRGCNADADCYSGSVRLLIPCYETYKKLLNFSTQPH